MIDNHIMHYSLCNILNLLFDFISFLGYHVVSINRTCSISNKTHIQTEVAPYSLILYSSSPLSLSYYLYFITHYQHEGYPTEREGIFFFFLRTTLYIPQLRFFLIFFSFTNFILYFFYVMIIV